MNSARNHFRGPWLEWEGGCDLGSTRGQEHRFAPQSCTSGDCRGAKASSTRRASQAVPHPSTDRALRSLTSEFEWDRVCSTQYGRWRKGTALNWSVSRPGLPTTNDASRPLELLEIADGAVHSGFNSQLYVNSPCGECAAASHALS